MDEAASRKQLKGYQAPKQLEKLQQRLEQILKEKEESIVLGDFEEASNLGQEQIRVEEELKKEQKKMDRKRSGKKLTVGEEDVADVGSRMDENTGQPPDRKRIRSPLKA